MAIIVQKEEEEEVKLGKSNNIAIVPKITLATIESLTFPLVQEVIFLADFRCKSCQDRVADIVSRLNGKLTKTHHHIPLFQDFLIFRWPKLIGPHDYRLGCKCDHNFGSFQDFLISRQPKLTGEADSVEISLMEKRVTITLARRRPRVAIMAEKELQRATNYKNTTRKYSLIKRIFCPISA